MREELRELREENLKLPVLRTKLRDAQKDIDDLNLLVAKQQKQLQAWCRMFSPLPRDQPSRTARATSVHPADGPSGAGSGLSVEHVN